MSASGRRYRGLSAEERRADQRERLVTRRDQRVLDARLPPHLGRRHRPQRAHEPHRVLRVLRQPRSRDVRRAASVAARPARRRAQRTRATPGPTRASSRSASPRSSSYLVSDPAAARILLLEGIGTSPEVNALRARVRSQVAERRARHLGRATTRRPRPRRRRRRSRSACSGCCSSRCCTWSRPAASTKRRRTSPRSSRAVERMLAPAG